MGIEPDTYPRLSHLWEPKEIETEADYKCAMLMVDLLAGHELNEAQTAYLDVISTHIEKYESIHYPICDYCKKSKSRKDMNGITFAGRVAVIGPDISTNDKRICNECRDEVTLGRDKNISIGFKDAEKNR